VKSRYLPLINSIGCLLLCGMVIVQWNNERRLIASIGHLKSELNASLAQSSSESQRRKALDHDIMILKESLEITQQAYDSSTRSLKAAETKALELETKANKDQAQLEAWKTAIDSRDEKLRNLNSELVATRNRLDDAINKLKAAGAK